MSQFDGVIHELEKGSRVYKAFQEAAQTIDVLRNVEQVASELTLKRDGLLQDIDAAQVKLDELIAHALVVQEQSDAVISEAKSMAAGITADARAAAANSIADAKEQVESLKPLADDAELRREVAEAAVVSANAEFKDIQERTRLAKEAAAKMLE